MNVKKVFLLCLGSFFLFSCSGPKKKEPASQADANTVPAVQKDSFEKSVLISSVVSNKDTAISYALYLPHQYSDGSKLPVFIFFDPHGDGAFPLNKYKLLSEKFGVLLIGSNNSKNGMNFDETNIIVQKLIDEAKERFHANGKQISLCGFSGGAKVALVAGMSLQGINSLVYCGAGIPAQQVAAMPPALAFAGVRDLNYSELNETDGTLEDKKIAHALLEWKGKHEWPDSIVFEDAFYWIRFRAMEAKADSVEHSLMNEFISANSKAMKMSLAEWMRLKKMISFLSGISDVSGYISMHEKLIKGKEFTSAVQKLNSDLAVERKIKQGYYENMQQKDLTWWKGEISRLNMGKAGNVMNDRLLGYISLMCFSVSNSAIKQGDSQMAKKALAIYKFADPQNPDRAFIEACLFARQNNKEAAFSALHEAIRLGFKDKTKLSQEESFASLRSLPEFNEMIQ